MPDPADLLNVARNLLQLGTSAEPADAHLRRAVSTAYYALFHKVLREAAKRFMGVDREQSAGYALLYRSFDHGRMKTACEEINKPTLSSKYRNALNRSAVSTDMRAFASGFPALQELRHLADYHPSTKFDLVDVESSIDAADLAISAFDRASPEEQADLLALMMVGIRS